MLDKDRFRKMIDEFYEYKGLDENGNFKPETLERLGLDNEPTHLL
jgi:aldehyde:ferredoxin oxidoreductase